MLALTFILGTLGSFISYKLNWGLTGTGAFLLLSAIINFVSFYFSHKIILKLSGAIPIERSQVPELYSIVERLCIKEQLPLPKICLMDSDAMNAFATGRNRKHAVIAVSRGLLEKLNSSEVEAVVGHELAHIQNGDMRLMTIITLLVGFISILADMYWRGISVSKADEKDRSGFLAIIGLVLSILAPIAAMFIQLAISRRREFVADARSAEMTNNPSALANALQKISRDLRPLPSSGVTTSHLYFSNPSKTTNIIEKMFSTHPPIEERISRLKSF